MSRIDVLDHGYVRFVEDWGYGDAKVSEAGIIEAARQSTQGSFRGWETDEKLLAYLYTHQHNTPFEFAGMVLEVQAPLFVFREWHRHRTQSYNEMSARYEPLPDLYYLPTVERLMINAGTSNKQAGTDRGSVPLTEYAAKAFIRDTEEDYEAWQASYELYLHRGIPKEVARIGMPVGHYSRMRASANLRNWLAFLTLRMDKNAQWEIREYANAVATLCGEHFPRTMNLFTSRVAA